MIVFGSTVSLAFCRQLMNMSSLLLSMRHLFEVNNTWRGGGAKTSKWRQQIINGSLLLNFMLHASTKNHEIFRVINIEQYHCSNVLQYCYDCLASLNVCTLGNTGVLWPLIAHIEIDQGFLTFSFFAGFFYYKKVNILYTIIVIMIIKHHSFFQRGRDRIKHCQYFPAICYKIYFQSGLVRSGLHRLVLASVQRSAAGSYCCQVASSTFASSILPKCSKSPPASS